MEDKLRGQVAIAELEVGLNKMGWNVFDFFRAELKRLVGIKKATKCGWYARKLEHGINYFLWQEHGQRLSQKYLTALKKGGWEVVCILMDEEDIG